MHKCLYPRNLSSAVPEFKSDKRLSVMILLDKLFYPNFANMLMVEKGESPNECYKKRKYAKFSEKRTFLTS